MAVDENLAVARRVGYGLKIGDDLPAPPREWAMEQVRSVPPLVLYGEDGTDILPSLPPEAKPYVNYAESIAGYAEKKNLQQAFDKTAGKLDPNLRGSRYDREIGIPYERAPQWRDCLVEALMAVNGPSPVFERFWAFWNNHFTVSNLNNTEFSLVFGSHHRAIRERMTGKFRDLLFDAAINPAMLFYLNNFDSTGPKSRAAREGRTNGKGLNENLGRELLELHTVSPAAGYTQDDVYQVALALTGFTFYRGREDGKDNNARIRKDTGLGARFNQSIHEPGTRTIMGKAYKGSGPDKMMALLNDLAGHPSTAKHISTKLARAFIADDPPPDCVERLAAVFASSDGDLVAVHSAVIDEVLIYRDTFRKLLTPIQWLLQVYKATGVRIPRSPPIMAGENLVIIYREIGQTFDECQQPNGYSDRMADWISNTMLDRRVRQGYRIGQFGKDLTTEMLGDYAERIARADRALPGIMRRAESRPVAVAVLFASPDFLFT